MERRPENISKLAFYLSDKEPLLYLFIINTDFCNEPDFPLFKEGGPVQAEAGVTYQNGRVKFIYSDEILSKKSKEELLFLIIHESFHIFKKHIERHKGLKNWLARNMAQDAVINEEIATMNFKNTFTPKVPAFAIRIPEKFKSEFRDLGNDAYTTERLYHWYLSQKPKKEDLLLPGSYVKMNKTGK